MSKPQRFQIFHDLVTQGVMAEFSHSDLVLLREVLYADCNVCQALISFAHRQAERLTPCTCSAALARRFLSLTDVTILTISDSALPEEFGSAPQPQRQSDWSYFRILDLQGDYESPRSI